MARRKQLFVPLAVDYASDDKIIEAGPMPELLYVRSLAFTKRTGSNGKIKRAQLQVVGLGLAQLPKLAVTLVQVGLWLEADDGWLIAAWFKHNDSTDHFDAETLAGKKANHVRWKHAGPFEQCVRCLSVHASESDSGRTPIGSIPDSKDRDRGETEVETEGEQSSVTSQNDDDYQNTPVPSSSSVDAAIRLCAEVVAFAASRTDTGYIRGIERNLRTERRQEFEDLIGQGRTLQHVVEKLSGHPTPTRVYMRQKGMEVVRPYDPDTGAYLQVVAL